jgi:hypothetical protein
VPPRVIESNLAKICDRETRIEKLPRILENHMTYAASAFDNLISIQTVGGVKLTQSNVDMTAVLPRHNDNDKGREFM